MKKTALIVGATGLIGKELLTILLDTTQYEKIITWVRRPSHFSHPKLTEHIIDFHDLTSYRIPTDVEDVYCCLGTTIKKAKSQEAFRQIDYTYPLQLAQMSKEATVQRFLVVTAIGANPQSSVFYNRTKGELEMALMDLHLPALHLFRPSLLLGERQEFRMGEKMAAYFFRLTPFFFIGPLKQYKPIHGRRVALAMLEATQTTDVGIIIHESIDMQP